MAISILFQMNIDESSNSVTDSYDSISKTPVYSRDPLSICSAASTSAPLVPHITTHSLKNTTKTLQQEKQHKDDEFEAFGKYLASELRAMDDIAMARRIKLKLNRYYLDCVDSEQQQEQITNRFQRSSKHNNTDSVPE